MLAVAAATSDPVSTTSLDVSLPMWAGLAVLVVVMLAIDFFVFARGGKTVTVRESAIWSVGWLAVALAFGAALWWWHGAQAGSEYLAGFILERSLSLDNVFVFAVIFAYFAVPLAVQPRVLSYGIALALVLRLLFILIGAALLASFHFTFYVFGALLLYTAWKLYRHNGAEIEPEHNPALKLLRSRVPMSKTYAGHRLFVRSAGAWVATPLVAVFVVVATTDVVFAIDSIPAIFAITQDPFIVFAANAFAMLGLRALYFLVVGAMDRFVYLTHGLSAILAFIGVKMLLIDVWHPPIWMSLAVIATVLTVTAIASVVADRRRGGTGHSRPEAPEAHGEEDDSADAAAPTAPRAAGDVIGSDDPDDRSAEETRPLETTLR
ncbi:MAG: Integral membrane protein TerC [uncultured Solirubrobacteraceae bacterium]|uniref:Integral membrane protein TerC n=1 Tax=uncultured Solirubrobacteraceae bacterium TaxID=1162706 RepID=A0A6J4R2J7_9ACTN|nr:MAG: Integral membrane protein TerC [uncultured Solirubrobacteraceae bacterium]